MELLIPVNPSIHSEENEIARLNSENDRLSSKIKELQKQIEMKQHDKESIVNRIHQLNDTNSILQYLQQQSVSYSNLQVSQGIH